MTDSDIEDMKNRKRKDSDTDEEISIATKTINVEVKEKTEILIDQSNVEKPKEVDISHSISHSNIVNENNFFAKKTDDKPEENKGFNVGGTNTGGGFGTNTGGGFGSNTGGGFGTNTGGGFGTNTGGGFGTNTGGGFGTNTGGGFGTNTGGGFGSSTSGGFGSNTGGFGSGGGFGSSNNGERFGSRGGRGGFRGGDRGGFRGDRGGRGGFRGGDRRGGFTGDRNFGDRGDRGGFGGTGGGFGNTGGGFSNFNAEKKDTIINNSIFNQNENKDTKLNKKADETSYIEKKIEKFEDHFEKSHIEIFEKCKNIFNYLDKKKVSEILIAAYQSQMTVFELINEFKREEKNSFAINFAESKYHVTFYDIPNVYEQREEDLIQDHVKVMKDYKTILKKENILTKEINDETLNLDDIQNKYVDPEEEMKYANNEEEHRRPVIKDKYLFNYYPCKCKVHLEGEKPDTCKFAHNENEILYHPLYYKTFICRTKNCNKKYCPNAHNITMGDLRRIYPYYMKCLISLTLAIENNVDNDKLKSYHEFIDNPMKFNLHDYKVKSCKDAYCLEKTDRHLCYNYHMFGERRRPPLLFRYSSDLCEFYTNTNTVGNFNYVGGSYCKNGNHCPKAHGNYERFYHPDEYQKTKCKKITCQADVCPYEDTCYGLHPWSKNKLKEQIYTNEPILSKKFICRKCGSLPLDFKYVYFKCCGYLTCSTCCSEMLNNFNNLLKNKKKATLTCIFCSYKLEKEILFKINFEKNSKGVEPVIDVEQIAKLSKQEVVTSSKQENSNINDSKRKEEKKKDDSLLDEKIGDDFNVIDSVL